MVFSRFPVCPRVALGKTLGQKWPPNCECVIYDVIWVHKPCWLTIKEPTCQCRRHGLDPWVRRIPWRRKVWPTPVFWLRKSHGPRSLGDYNPWGHKRVGRDLATKQWIHKPTLVILSAGLLMVTIFMGNLWLSSLCLSQTYLHGNRSPNSFCGVFSQSRLSIESKLLLLFCNNKTS